jgi:membrane associated rhomboid family serine protease
VFPIRDDNPTHRFPFINFLLIIANVVAAYFLFKEMILDREVGEALVTHYAMIPARDFDWTHWSISQITPALTSMFMHGGIMHLLLNMWSLWIFGDNIENAFGSFRYLLFYLLCGIVAAFTHAYLEPDSILPVVGASGAISGVMGAYLLLYPRAKIRMFTLLIFYPIFFEIPAVVFLVIWFAGQLFAGASTLVVSSQGTEAGGIAIFAHIGGFVAGMILTPILMIGRSRRGRAR